MEQNWNKWVYQNPQKNPLLLPWQKTALGGPIAIVNRIFANGIYMKT